MSGTFGPHGTTSSESAALREFLASRLMARTAGCGSTLFKLTWKRTATPSGRSYSLLRASVLRTPGTEHGSWPTPTVMDANRGAKDSRPWDTGRPLNQIAALASWATPAAKEAGGTPEQFLARKVKARENGAELGISLTSLALQAQLSTWATPANRDYRTPNLKPYSERGGGAKGQQLNNQVVHSGPALTGSSAETASGARLNPAHSRWLQALPPAWDACAPMATRSARKPRKPSSKPPMPLSLTGGIFD